MENEIQLETRMIPLYSLLGHQSLEKNISVDLHILCPLLVSQKGILKANAIHLAKSARQIQDDLSRFFLFLSERTVFCIQSVVLLVICSIISDCICAPNSTNSFL